MSLANMTMAAHMEEGELEIEATGCYTELEVGGKCINVGVEDVVRDGNQGWGGREEAKI